MGGQSTKECQSCRFQFLHFFKLLVSSKLLYFIFRRRPKLTVIIKKGPKVRLLSLRRAITRAPLEIILNTIPSQKQAVDTNNNRNPFAQPSKKKKNSTALRDWKKMLDPPKNKRKKKVIFQSTKTQLTKLKNSEGN